MNVAVAGLHQPTKALVALPKTATRQTLTAEILEGPAAYETLSLDWQRLVGKQPGSTLFQTPELLSIWARHFASGSELVTVVVREGVHVVLIWPLAVARRGLVRVAEGAGAPISQYDDLLLDPEADAALLFDTALKILKAKTRPDFVSFDRVRADGALRSFLCDIAPVCAAEAAPYVDLSDGADAALSKMKSSVARKQRKRVRRFMKSGDVHFEIARNAAEAEAWLAGALKLKRAWLKETGRISRGFLNPETGDCLIELARRLDGTEGRPRMVVSRVSLDGHTAAIEAAICHRGTYHLYLRAFAPVFAAYGPGNILTEHMLGWSAENGITRYDMLAPRSRNKREWQSGEVAVADFALPLTLVGHIYKAAVLTRLGPWLKRGFYALPPKARSVIVDLALPR